MGLSKYISFENFFCSIQLSGYPNTSIRNPFSSLIIWISLLLVLCTCSLFAQPPSKVYVNLTRGNLVSFNRYWGDKQFEKYYLIFSTHAKQKDFDPNVDSFAGHAWVMWAHENPLTKSTEIQGWGFWPDRDKMDDETGRLIGNILTGTTPVQGYLTHLAPPIGISIGLGQTAISGMPGQVPGKLRTDLLGVPYAKTLKQVVFEVDQQTYEQTLNVRDTYTQGHPNYALLEKDCVSFFIDVGNAMGLKMPDRSVLNLKSWYPTDYMDLFVEQLKSKGIPLSVQPGQVTVSGDGSSVVYFDQNNANHCNLDGHGGAVENKIRGNNQTCQEVYFPNGSSWYSETAPPFSQAPPGPFNKPISTYRFPNGNTIESYDPNTFNPNFVPMDLATGNQDYLGGINSEGIPNGNGTIREKGFDQHGMLFGNSKTGLFVDGVFQNYAGLNIGNGMAYGEFHNGQPTGQVRVEFNDGRIFAGTFIGGKANGKGMVTNKAGTFSYTGDFKDGFCEGQGTYWESGGRGCQGTYKHGILINGRVTLPDGNYYVGTFDDKGHPTGGQSYDKSGRILNDHYTHETYQHDTNNPSKDSVGDFCTGHVDGHDETCGQGGLSL